MSKHPFQSKLFLLPSFHLHHLTNPGAPARGDDGDWITDPSSHPVGRLRGGGALNPIDDLVIRRQAGPTTSILMDSSRIAGATQYKIYRNGLHP